MEKYGGPGRDRTDDLFHAMAATTVHSTTYKWVRELPIPCKYVQERGAQKDLGLDFGLASATIEVFVAGERFPKPHRTSLVQECGIGVVPGARAVPNAPRVFFNLQIGKT